MLRAINPWYAVEFFLREGLAGFTMLGAVILVVTGGEALYADMGHFGRRPIRLAWFAVVLPALVLNYFGQGALLLADPAAARNPFYSLVPSWALYPMVAVATAAAVVASQALISGAFSLTRQAVQLGYCPRVNIVHTSKTEIGQIYIPAVNNLLMVACLGLVVDLPVVGQPRRDLRRGAVGHDDHHQRALRRGRAEALGLEPAEGGGDDGPVPGRGPGIRGRQPAQDSARRLVPAGGGGPSCTS